MAKYKVLHYFEDLQDQDHAYEPGEEFPRPGLTVSKARFKELAGSDNKQGRPLIKAVSNDVKQVKKTVKHN